MTSTRARRALAGVIAGSLLALPTIARAAAPAQGPFAFAGVIEGSYGPPWSHADRASAIAWMATEGLDTYVHAPKFDAYQRAQWREPYPAADMADFASEIGQATRQGVAWVPNISPGFPLIPGAPSGANVSRDLCFSCPEDVAVLLAKLEPFFAAGARRLMVSFDDVQKISSHPEDLARYGNGAAAYGHMTRDLLNAVQRHFQARAGRTRFRLLTVLADYSGTADTDYLKAVRADGGLDRSIDVLWTGTTVVARSIRAADAAAYARLAGRTRVGIWDNYPTNDFAGNAAGRPVRLFLGPYAGRDPRLATAVSGIVANVMNEAAANRFALGTLARYAADPRRYRPEAAWRATITDLARGNPRLADALAALAENSRSSALDRSEATVFVPLRDTLLGALDGPYWPESARRLRAELERERRAPALITRWFPELAEQVSPFLERLAAQAGTASTAADLLAAQRPTLRTAVRRGARSTTVTGTVAAPSPADALRLLGALLVQHAADLAAARYVHGDRLTPSLSDPTTVANVYVDENRVDALVAAVRARTAAWIPVAPSAASGVTLTLDGRPVPVGPGGSFSIRVARASGLHRLVATDGGGNATGVRVAT